MQPNEYADPSPYLADLWTALANPRRRMIIRLLAMQSPLSIKTIASYIVLAESDVESLADVSYDMQHSVNVTLYQTHVETLETQNIVIQMDKDLHRGVQFETANQVVNAVDSVVS